MAESATQSTDPATADGESRPSAELIPITGSRRRRAFQRRLEAMSPEQRREAAQAGRFSRAERALWASLHPEDVPTVNGEFEWIALGLAGLD